MQTMTRCIKALSARDVVAFRCVHQAATAAAAIPFVFVHHFLRGQIANSLEERDGRDFLETLQVRFAVLASCLWPACAVRMVASASGSGGFQVAAGISHMEKKDDDEAADNRGDPFVKWSRDTAAGHPLSELAKEEMRAWPDIFQPFRA